MKSVARVVILASLHLLLSPSASPMSFAQIGQEGFKAATTSRSVQPLATKSPKAYSETFSTLLSGVPSNMAEKDHIINMAEKNLKRLADDRGKYPPFPITEDGLNRASKKLAPSHDHPYTVTKNQAINSAKEGIDKESKAYRALAQGDWEKALQLITSAAKEQEFSHLAKEILENRQNLIPYAFPMKVKSTLQFSEHERIRSALQKLEEFKKAYQSIPSRNALKAVIDHFGQLGYPSEGKLKGSALAKDRIRSWIFGQSGLKSYLEGQFKRSATKASMYGEQAKESLARNDRLKAVDLIKKLRASRKKAGNYHSRYYQNGHGTIDLKNDPSLGNFEGASSKTAKPSEAQLKVIITRLATLSRNTPFLKGW